MTPALDRLRALEFGPGITHVMAVVNLSPESRVAHSVVGSPAEALERARASRDLGASIIDLGAQSSHFENQPLAPAEEIDRMLPALALLVDDGFVVSVDTWKPEVAAVAVAAGAAIVNDTGGLADPLMVDVVRAAGAGAVVMHIEGANPLEVGYRALEDGQPEIVAAGLADRVAQLRTEGLTGPLLVDPGLSINYRSDYERYGQLQLATIRSIDALRAAGEPVLIPVPRKAITHRMVAYLTLSIEYGADVLRVHDVDAACDLVTLLGRQLG
ncbi:MAG: dihydropteroate synthase [Acidimicrobiia bacterium]|nr:dihydropteroate synthase [Acidimicrobiia bacterium]